MAVLDARMGEVYAAAYEFDADCWHRRSDFCLCRPELLNPENGWTLAGNALAVYGERLPGGDAWVNAAPTAAALLRLAPALLAAGQAVPAAGALPLYIRNKVAQTTAERAALRAPVLPSP